MKFHEALGEQFASLTTVVGIVGNRIYPITSYQEDQAPLIIWDFTLRSRVDLSHNLTNEADITALCYAANLDDAIALGYAVRDGLHAQGVNWGTTGSLRIAHCTFREMDTFPSDNGDGTYLVCAAVQFSLLYGPES